MDFDVFFLIVGGFLVGFWDEDTTKTIVDVSLDGMEPDVDLS